MKNILIFLCFAAMIGCTLSHPGQPACTTQPERVQESDPGQSPKQNAAACYTYWQGSCEGYTAGKSRAATIEAMRQELQNSTVPNIVQEDPEDEVPDWKIKLDELTDADWSIDWSTVLIQIFCP